MERRLGHHGLMLRTTFIEAIPADSSEVDERLEGLGAAATVPLKRVEAAVLASHLKAIRRFVEHGPASADGVIICEDDLLFHNDWNDRVPAIFDNMPGDLTLCLLSFLATSWDGAQWAGRNPECHNLSTFDAATTWGSQMYWISRRYAETVLERWDCPFKHLPPQFMAEVIVKWSSGLMCYPLLAIEDVIDSEVRPAEEITGFHLPLVRSWGYDNFSACEEGDESSPLAAQTSPRTITVGLAVIARDEEHSLPALLATCNGAFDQVLLVDTGSKDATVQRFTEWAETQPSTRCEVEHFAWIDDFSAARQRADDLLDTEWKVWADCDDEILGATHLRELAAAAPPDVAGFRFGYDYARDAGGSSTCYTKRERMVRSGHGRWVGRVHEVQTIDGRLEDVVPEVAEWIHHRERKASTGGGRPTGRDIQLLTEALEEDPNDPRTVFYLAQSNRDAGHRTRAIELYLRRAEMGGWSEEVFYSLYQAGVLRAQDGNQMEGMRLLLQAWELRPSRAEPLYELAWRMRAGGDHRSAYLFARQGLDRPEPDDSLFVERWIYRWGLLFECSISAYWVGEVVEAEQACLRLLALPDLPESNRKQTQMNLEMIRRSPAAESVHPAPREQSLIRTAQPAGEETPSAYDLVGDGMHPARGGLSVRVINLDRRPDRLASFLAGLEKHAGPNMARRCRRFPAVDGTTIQMTDDLRLLFRNNDFADRRGNIGCALSHLRLWREIADGSSAACLIFEDDAQVEPGFVDELRATVQAVDSIDADWHIVFLGYVVWPDAGSDTPVRTFDARVCPMRWDRYLGGTYCYLISKDGASRLVELAETGGVHHGIDRFVMYQQSELSAFEVLVPLARSPLASAQSQVDSDIQYDCEAVAALSTNLAPRPLADLATSLVLAELRLELPERWNAFDALISLDGDDYRVEVSVTTPGDLQKLVVRLNARLEVDVVEVLGDGTHLGTHEDGNLQVPVGFVSSTPAVTLPLGDLCVLEQRKSDLASLVFALLDSTRRVIAASPPFKMVSGSSEERCSGLVVRDDEVILSFGIDKEAIGLAVLDTEEVLGLLEPCQ
jgi:GR25 family glycosyltransferase involved in LPS biosynthesis